MTDEPYSFLADWLSKFYLAPWPIQVLWILVVPTTLISIAAIITRGCVRIAELGKRD